MTVPQNPDIIPLCCHSLTSRHSIPAGNPGPPQSLHWLHAIRNLKFYYVISIINNAPKGHAQSIMLTKQISFLDKHCFFFLTTFFLIYIQKIEIKMTGWSWVSLYHCDMDKPFCKEIINKYTTNVNFC